MVESERVIEKALLLDAVNALVVAAVSRMLQKVIPVVICGPCVVQKFIPPWTKGPFKAVLLVNPPWL